MDECVAAVEPHSGRCPRDGVLRPCQLPRHGTSLTHKSYLPPVYVVSWKVMLSVMSVCESVSVCSKERAPHVTTTHDAIGQSWDPHTTYHIDLFKLVCLGSPYHLDVFRLVRLGHSSRTHSHTSFGNRVFGLQLEGLLVTV